MTTPVNPVGYAELHTQDPPRARAFYTELFGWKAEEEQTPMGPYTMFRDVLAGLVGNAGGVPVGWVPYINVDDLARKTKQAKALGAEVLRDCIAIPQGSFSIVRDPTGGVLGLWQKK
jgi:predicted enzyme related to lactoylglutathione lyase